MRANWWGVLAVAVVSIVSAAMAIAAGQYDDRILLSLENPSIAVDVASAVRSIRDSLRWIAFCCTLVALRQLVLLCVRTSA